VFASLTPHRQSTPKNGLRHFSALPTHRPKMSEAIKNTAKLKLAKKKLKQSKKKCNFAD